MKKIILCMVFALCAAASANAYAADPVYNDATDTVTADESGIKTVIITKVTGEKLEDKDIYYMDQALQGSTLNAALGFAMKKDTPAGTYKMTLRYDDPTAENKTITFSVANQVKSADLLMTPLTGSNPPAFVTTDAVNSSEYKSIKVGFTKNGATTYFGCNLSELEVSEVSLLGEGAFLGIQLDDVTEAYDSISMYLSKDELTKKGVTNND